MENSLSEQGNHQINPLSLVRARAMDLLARREHSSLELKQKLCAKLPEHSELVETVIDRLQQDQLQSDERFAEAFLSSRVKKGQGPRRIGMELQQRGVSSSIIGAVIADCTVVDWYQLANEVLIKKYGNKPCVDFKEQAKRRQFLHYRGFNTEHISACFDQ